MDFIIALKWPLIIVQAICSSLLIISVLLQSGKGDDIGSALSGASSGSTESGGASKFLIRLTVICAVIFMLNSIVLAKIFKEIGSSSVTSTVSEPLVPATTAANVLEGSPTATNTLAPAPAKK